MRMKKNAVALYFLLLAIATLFSLYIPKGSAAGEDVVVIPKEAIRLRILAHSNSPEDQEIKRIVRDRVNAQITEWVEGLRSLEEARKVIKDHLGDINNIAQRVLDEAGSTHAVQTEFGRVSFPTKLYGNFLYPAGQYEAILITIGDGHGANWWCVLFPPLCFLDFSSGSAVSDGFDEEPDEGKVEEDSTKTETPIYDGSEEEVEVKFFIVELIEKIINFFSSLFSS